MIHIFKKEVSAFFSSLIGYIVIGVFLTITGLVMFVFPDTNLLLSNYASIDQLFGIAPQIFMFLIPAITMSSFSEEQQSGTIELLATRPLTDLQIVGGKYAAGLFLVAVSLIPTVLYYITVYELGSPKGNLDTGGIIGSYIGLFFLASAFVAIGIFASTLSRNQIVAFVLAAFLSFLIYFGFDFFSRLPIFIGNLDGLIQSLGIDYHYSSLSRGVIDSRDVVYFLSLNALFLFLTKFSLESRKW